MAVYIEWITLEVTVFIIMMFDDYNMLAAHCACINFIGFIQMMIDGINSSVSSYVSIAAGEGSTNKTRKTAYVGLIMYSFLSLVIFGLVYGNCEWISEFYTDEEHVTKVTS